MTSARRRAATGSGPYTFHNLSGSIQNTDNGLHDHTGDAPRHALEEAADAALLCAPHRLQEHAGHSFANTSHDALRAARGLSLIHI